MEQTMTTRDIGFMYFGAVVVFVSYLAVVWAL